MTYGGAASNEHRGGAFNSGGGERRDRENFGGSGNDRERSGGAFRSGGGFEREHDNRRQDDYSRREQSQFDSRGRRPEDQGRRPDSHNENRGYRQDERSNRDGGRRNEDYARDGPPRSSGRDDRGPRENYRDNSRDRNRGYRGGNERDNYQQNDHGNRSSNDRHSFQQNDHGNRSSNDRYQQNDHGNRSSNDRYQQNDHGNRSSNDRYQQNDHGNRSSNDRYQQNDHGNRSSNDRYQQNDHGNRSSNDRYQQNDHGNRSSNDRYQQNDHGNRSSNDRNYDDQANNRGYHNDNNRQSNFQNRDRDSNSYRNGTSENDGSRSFDRRNGFGHQQQFDNGGGFQSGNGGNGGPRHNNYGSQNNGGQSADRVNPVTRAPIDYMPEFENVEDVIKKVAERTDELKVDEDQELEIRNSDIDTKLTSWENSGLDPRIIQNLRNLNYKTVRPIQAAVLPQVLNGYDVMGQAETGGGKTAAFGIPIVHKILNLKKEEREDASFATAPLALILAPTRELVHQIYLNMTTYVKGTNVTCAVTYGQMDSRQSLNNINKGCEILVGSCGRIMDFVEKGKISLKYLRFFVLDEADRLLCDSKENASHLQSILQSAGFRSTDNTRQTILTSATFDDDVMGVARGIMRPIKGQDEIVRIVLARGRLNLRVHLSFYETADLADKQNKLRELLSELNEKGQVPKTLVFVERKAQCNNITYKLVQKGIKATTLHGDIGQDTRNSVIEQFRKGQLRILVATDVMARGIDILDLERVINFDLPEKDVKASIDTFVHRTGRTGRLSSGQAISFVNPTLPTDCRLCPEIIELIKSQDRADEIPDWLNEIARKEGKMLSSGSAAPRSNGGFTGAGGFSSGSFATASTGGFNGRVGNGGFGNSGFGGPSGESAAYSNNTGFGGALAKANSNDNDGTLASDNNATPKVSMGFQKNNDATPPPQASSPGSDAAQPPGGGFMLNKILDSPDEPLGSSSFGGPSEPKKELSSQSAAPVEEDPEDEW